jgi:hypothetical protein
LAFAAAAAAIAILGPCLRAAPVSWRRCDAGKRRQMS